MNSTQLNIAYEPEAIARILDNQLEMWYVLKNNLNNDLGVVVGSLDLTNLPSETSLHAILPPIKPEHMGDSNFCQTYAARFPYVVGEMANGIATAEMVIAAANAGLIGFFGAGGLMPARVAENIARIKQALPPHLPWGVNLIHSPNEPAIEQAVMELFLQHEVRIASASAYMNLTPTVVQYAFTGIKENPDGSIQRPNHVFAKLSRAEVAEQFLQPPPADLLQALVNRGKLTQQEAQLASQLPTAEDITAESDSGGHTDNRPAITLLPIIKNLAIEIAQKNNYKQSIRVGLGGSIACPEAVAAAFAMGAAYVLTGTINQSTVEAGLSLEGKQLLAEADMADVMMTAAADMFERGVKLQVLKRGTLFAVRANKLYDIYTQYSALEDIPVNIKQQLEQQIFRQPLEEIWQQTREFFNQRDASQVEIAERNPKYKMALIFRWYLGHSSRWAIAGDASRRADYQIWCGPGVGAFNRFIKDSPLADLQQRKVADVAMQLLSHACHLLRVMQLRSLGVPVPQKCFYTKLAKKQL